MNRTMHCGNFFQIWARLLRTLGTAGVAVVLVGCASGRRWHVGNVRFEGNNAFTRRELISRMESRPAVLWRRTRYSAGKVQGDIRTIQAIYRDQGYLSTEVSVSRVERDTARRRVEIFLDVNEGPQTIVDTILIDERTGLSRSTLNRFVPIKSGGPFSPARVRIGSRSLADSLGKFGYLYARAWDSAYVDSVNHRATVTYTVQQGPKAKVGSILVNGTQRVEHRVVTRELRFRPGEILTTPKVSSSIRSIYGTGLFNQVQIRSVPPDSSEREHADTVVSPVNVEVSEADFFQVQAGIGYGDPEGFRGSLQSSYANLWGIGHRIGLEGRLSSQMQEVLLRYATPYFLVVPLNTSLELYGQREYNSISDTTGESWLRRGLIGSVASEPGNRLLYRVWSRFEWVTYDSIVLNDTALLPDTRFSRTQTIGANVAFDTRNSLLNPQRGGFASIETELAGLTGRAGNQFATTLLDLRGYMPLSRSVTFSSGVNVGYVLGYGASRGFVARQEQLSVGRERIRSVRGFSESEMGGRGTLALACNLGELRFPIYQIIGGALFVDVGAVWDSPESVDANDLRWSIGPGLRVTTPIGIASLDLGVKLSGPDLGGTRLHFTIGQPF